jgi:hypothetical protein
MNVDQICEFSYGVAEAKCYKLATWVVLDKTTGKITYRCMNPIHYEMVGGHTYSMYALTDYTKHGGHDLPYDMDPLTCVICGAEMGSENKGKWLGLTVLDPEHPPTSLSEEPLVETDHKWVCPHCLMRIKSNA